MAEINFKCENCDFSFLEKNLIFYLDTDLDDLESILNFYSNDGNTKNHLNLIPENNKLFTQEEIENVLEKEISKNHSNYKILFFDFKKTFYKDRRNVLENNNCPNCNSEMSLVISEKTPCPKCGSSLKEEF